MKIKFSLRQINSSAQKTLLSFLSIGLLATGCGEMAVRRLASTTPQGSPFNVALSKEYLTLATTEARTYYDQGSASYFGDKGLAAAQNLPVDPENPAEWDLPAEVLPEISAARERLMTALNSDARVRDPQLAAQAQERFDCWVEEQRENWQTENIQACRGDFYAFLDQLEKPQQVTSQPPQIQPLPQPAYTSFQAQALYFDFDKSNIRPDAKKIIAQTAELIKANPNWRIGLDGHADLTGKEKYNLQLSKKRAHSVKEALIARGVPAGHLIEHGFGTEGAAGVKGKPNQADRRVDIHLLK